MTWLIGGLCLFVAAMLLGRWFLTADPKVLAKVVRRVAIGGAGALALFIVLTGRFALLLPIALIGFPLIRRWLSPGRLWPRTNPTPGQSSSVETDYVEMGLDHDSGQMSGRIKRGSFAGRQLGDLSETDLIELLRECLTADPEGAQLVEAFLDRSHSDWREKAGTTGTREGGARAQTGPMTREQAFEILGLSPGASDSDIRDAHHRLMKKIHPDQGGSTYLAAQINQAKEVLLGS